MYLSRWANFWILITIQSEGNELEHQFSSVRAKHYFPVWCSTYYLYARSIKPTGRKPSKYTFLRSSEPRLIREDFIIYIWGVSAPTSLLCEWYRIQEMRLSPTCGVTNGLGWYRPRNFARNLGRRGRCFCLGGGATIQATFARTTVASINPLGAMIQLLLAPAKITHPRAGTSASQSIYKILIFRRRKCSFIQ